MKVLHEIYDFVTGGSIVAPVGVIAALALGFATQVIDPSVRAALVFGTVLFTFAASALERPT